MVVALLYMLVFKVQLSKKEIELYAHQQFHLWAQDLQKQLEPINQINLKI